MRRTIVLAACFLTVLLLFSLPATAAELLVGAAAADIGPTGPVALWGQFYLRIARTGETPLVAAVVVLESRQGERPLDAAVMVSCDLCAIPDDVRDLVRQEVVKDNRYTDVPLVHSVQTIRLPMRLVTEAEYAEAQAGFQRAADQIAKDLAVKDRMHGRMIFHQHTIARFEAQAKEPEPTYEMELHVLRLGDVVIC